MMHDGRVLFRCKSHKEAMDMRAQVVRMSREEALGLTIGSVKITSEYVGDTALSSADARYCHWALRHLGDVSIAASDADGASRFVVRSNSGQRAEGRTLPAALFELVGEPTTPARRPSRREPKRKE
ncbi:hypothetical protein VOM14_30900 [Paraburkholderia sp. MPAMCS5]|uniref:hypothetical protein n=1 Tax=Paraburkholderia sp. MPAMCS5 TaxID=3112563 RepID=UPI002E17E250|nr:hypothetical protein [Paraburkholderia sp. MPAMCS5]